MLDTKLFFDFSLNIRKFCKDSFFEFWSSRLYNDNIVLHTNLTRYYYLFVKDKLYSFNKFQQFNNLTFVAYRFKFFQLKFFEVRKNFMLYMKTKINLMFQMYNRSYNLSKKSVVIPSRNLTFERRNLYYNESFRKYKHYFDKPSINNTFSTYIDYMHDFYLSKLFSSDLEITRIRYVKNMSLHSDSSSIPMYKRFLYDLYYDFFLQVELFFPYYDLYSVFAFLF